MWLADEFADAGADALAAYARERDAEQAVRGLDALEEVAFHPLLAAAFATPEHVCLREAVYPSEPAHRPDSEHILDADVRELADPITGEIPSDRALRDPKRSERRRCDLVVLPPGTAGLVDAIVSRASAKAARARVAGTLFESIAIGDPEAAPDPALAHPADALWIEVKAVGQFCYTSGVGGPNRSYAPELTRGAVADVRKLASDPLIENAALLLVLFTLDEATAEHDLAAFTHRCLDKGLSVSAPVVRGFDISDRIGNRRANIAVVRVRR